MSTINNVVNSTYWNIQSYNKNASLHTHPQIIHSKSNSQDSIQISEEGKQASNNAQKSSLDSLVTYDQSLRIRRLL